MGTSVSVPGSVARTHTYQSYLERKHEGWVAEVTNPESGGFMKFEQWEETYEPDVVKARLEAERLKREAEEKKDSQPSESFFKRKALSYMASHLHEQIMLMLWQMLSRLLAPAEDALHERDPELAKLINAVNGVVLSYRFQYLDREKFGYIREIGVDRIVDAMTQAIERESARIKELHDRVVSSVDEVRRQVSDVERKLVEEASEAKLHLDDFTDALDPVTKKEIIRQITDRLVQEIRRKKDEAMEAVKQMSIFSGGDGDDGPDAGAVLSGLRNLPMLEGMAPTEEISEQIERRVDRRKINEGISQLKEWLQAHLEDQISVMIVFLRASIERLLEMALRYHAALKQQVKELEDEASALYLQARDVVHEADQRRKKFQGEVERQLQEQKDKARQAVRRVKMVVLHEIEGSLARLEGVVRSYLLQLIFMLAGVKLPDDALPPPTVTVEEISEEDGEKDAEEAKNEEKKEEEEEDKSKDKGKGKGKGKGKKKDKGKGKSKGKNKEKGKDKDKEEKKEQPEDTDRDADGEPASDEDRDDDKAKSQANKPRLGGVIASWFVGKSNSTESPRAGSEKGNEEELNGDDAAGEVVANGVDGASEEDEA